MLLVYITTPSVQDCRSSTKQQRDQSGNLLDEMHRFSFYYSTYQLARTDKELAVQLMMDKAQHAIRRRTEIPSMHADPFHTCMRPLRASFTARIKAERETR